MLEIIFSQKPKTQQDFLSTHPLELKYQGRERQRDVKSKVHMLELFFIFVSFLFVKSSTTRFLKVSVQAFLQWMDISSTIGSTNDMANDK